MRFHRGYVIATITLSALAFVTSLWISPEWGQSLKLVVALAAAAVVGAVGFVAAWRQAVEAPQPDPLPPSAAPVAPAENIGMQLEDYAAVGGDLTLGPKMSAGRDMVLGTVQNIQLPDLANALHQLPAPPADFIGRTAELKDLREKIGQGGAISFTWTFRA
jgi:hypothetical protein